MTAQPNGGIAQTWYLLGRMGMGGTFNLARLHSLQLGLCLHENAQIKEPRIVFVKCLVKMSYDEI